RSVTIDVDGVLATSFDHDQTDGHGPCRGDSGSPAIATIADAETVIGVFSYGDQACASFARYQRTDSESAFLSLFAPEPDAVELGACAVLALAACTRRRG